jgi:hypothetical protein
VSDATASGRASIGSTAPISTRPTSNAAKLEAKHPISEPIRTSASDSWITGTLPIMSASREKIARNTTPARRLEVTSHETVAGAI